MITLDSIKGTWMEDRIKNITKCSSDPVREAETFPNCEMPAYMKLPASRGGKTKTTLSAPQP